MVSLHHLKCTVPFILFPFFLQFVSSDASTTFLGSYCYYVFNYTQNSVFQGNLNLVLTNVSSEAPLSNFYYTSYGQGVDEVHALLFCPAYITAQDCHACIQAAAQNIALTCPNQKAATIFYVECVLRYANYSSFPLEEVNLLTYRSSTTTSNNPDQLDQVMTNKMGSLIAKAAFGSSTPTFATGEGNITVSQQLYCFVQCIPPIGGNGCYKCLSSALAGIKDYCYGREWAMFYEAACQMRYSLSPFYVVAPSPSLPPSSGSTSAQPSSGKNRNASAAFIIAIVSVGIFAILVILIVSYLMRRKVRTSRESTEIESLQFDFTTIRNATNNFSDANKLGEGGYGPVYKGVLLNGQEIAVKKLSHGSRYHQQQFQNEVLLLARLSHTNLVRLLGFSLEGDERLLIYEFMPNKSLDHFIFDPVKRAHLDWKCCKAIIQGIAEGLVFLHRNSPDKIIHRDLKAGNILLDVKMKPKIADFGTARLLLLGRSDYTASNLAGTWGYMAPEYIQNGRFSVRSDVYSFGVIMLEILSGQKIARFRDREDGENLLSYAWKSWRDNRALDIVDSTLTSGPIDDIQRYIQIGLLCVQEKDADRPTMDKVATMLAFTFVTLPLPLHPALFVPERGGDQGSLLHEFNAMLREPNQSEYESAAECSVYEDSVTVLDA